MNPRKRTGRAAPMLMLLLLALQGPDLLSQDIRLSLWTDPLLSWFSSDTQESSSSGIRPGFNAGIGIDRYFRPNYAFSTGIFLTNCGGNMVYSDTVRLSLKNSRAEVLPQDKVIYRIKYLTIPVGIKLKTDQIGYISFYSNVGLDARFAISRKVNIPALDIEGESITDELAMLNFGYHLHAGVEYSLGGSTALAIGLGYESSFFDVTRDNGTQPDDRITQNLLLVKLGIIF